MQIRLLDGKLALLFSMLVLQVLIVMIYVALTPPTEAPIFATRTPVSFVKFESTKENGKPLAPRPPPIFRTPGDPIFLKDTKTTKLFRAFNGSSCFLGGVDEQHTLEGKHPGKCTCRTGWHGSDCGQPEVAWRAIMASKQKVQLKRRKLTRRIVHAFCFDDANSAIAEAAIEELDHVVDLFLVCDLSASENNFRHRLSKGLLRPQQRKILYLNATDSVDQRSVRNFLWESARKLLRNLRDDDVYAVVEPEEILNSKALMFLKIYDGWPQPIGFRLRWSVYGFYWQHPLKTTIVVAAYTVALFNSRSRVLEGNNGDNLGLVIGDLNHYGGWYCHYCESPANIVNLLHRDNETRRFTLDKNVDVVYVEDLIGAGLWLDGKTNLLRASKSREPYFAPDIVLNETWKYDWLLENLYAKMDYY